MFRTAPDSQIYIYIYQGPRYQLQGCKKGDLDGKFKFLQS